MKCIPTVDPDRIVAMRNCLLRLMDKAHRLNRPDVVGEIMLALGTGDIRATIGARLNHPTLSQDQWRILEVIEETWIRTGDGPTQREVADRFIATPGTVCGWIRELVKMGHLSVIPDKSTRNLFVPGYSWESTRLTPEDGRAAKHLRIIADRVA